MPTYPLTFPTTIAPESVSFAPRSAVAISASPFTFTQQAQVYSGQQWQVDFAMPPMVRADASEFIAFMLRLNGRQGTFLFGDPNGQVPRGSASATPGTPLVMGAGQTGDSLIVDGLPTSTTGYLLAGDYIQLGSGNGTRLHMVTANVNSDGDGEATIEIWPSLRESPDNNAAVTVSGCKGVFRMSSNVMGFDINAPFFYSMTFSAYEALGV
jgi:hypothetical protein